MANKFVDITHPTTGEVSSVTERKARVLAKSGWIRTDQTATDTAEAVAEAPDPTITNDEPDFDPSEFDPER